MDFTNSTHGPGCHNPPGPRTCRHKLPTHLGLSLSPGTLEGHQPQVLAIHPPQNTHTLLHTPKGVAEAPTFKGPVPLSYTPGPHMERVRISACNPGPPFTHGTREPLPVPHPAPHPQCRARVPTLQTGGLRPGKRLESGETGAAGGSAQQAGPGSGCPVQPSRTRGKRFHAVVHRDPAWREAGC